MAALVRAIVVLGIPSSTRELLDRARAIVQAMAANRDTFAKPSPTLAQVTAALNALDAAETATGTRAPVAFDVRDEKRDALIALLRQLRTSVQVLVDAEPAQASRIAKSAAMRLGERGGVRRLAGLTVTSGGLSGAVTLVAGVRAARRVAHEWQYSLDQKTWLTTPATLQARTTIANLAPGALTWFRHRVVTKDGPGEWSQMVSLIVQ